VHPRGTARRGLALDYRPRRAANSPDRVRGRSPLSLYEQVAGLPVEIDGSALARLELPVSTGLTRVTTVVRLRGGGAEGIGEDVTYSTPHQDAFQSAFGSEGLPLAGRWSSFEELSRHVGDLDLFPGGADHDVYRSYRRWGVESAALDLALRQAGRSLADVLGRELRPVRFVVSLRLGDPPTLDPVRSRLDRYPGLRFKLDPTPGWDEPLVRALAETGAVDSVDLKGAYRGTVVDNPADPRLYRLVAEGFPDAWIEDPDLSDPDADAVLEPHRDRITWDAVIHSIADIEALPFPPRMLNMKPSRFGSVRALLDAYEWCERNGVAVYGGGQFELGPGRGQIQYLASLFGPDEPNDVAPAGFHASDVGDGLPTSPLAPVAEPVGFRWG
jgi:L-alanine-DL-glutamate epimerase-like enolase superfamily enzyme